MVSESQRKIVERFEIDYIQILDENGKVIDGTVAPKLNNDFLAEKYRLMRFLRTFDNKALSLQRQGRMGTYSEFKGQEAVQIGISMALERQDWFFPTYRDSAAMIARGVPPENLLLYWSGDEMGQSFPENINVFPIAIPVASQVPHAVGAAWAFRYEKKNLVSLFTIGDGGTSKADFYEGLNIAGEFGLPVICVIQNNQYAISLPRRAQTASETLAQKAIGLGIEGIQVDGNDLLAVYSVLKKAVDKARAGKGPTIAECITYRLGHHTTATGDETYRADQELEKWRHRDPVERLRRYLEQQGAWNENVERRVDEDVKGRVDEAVRKFESFQRPSVSDMFAYAYADMPPKLEKELRYVERFAREADAETRKEESQRDEKKALPPSDESPE